MRPSEVGSRSVWRWLSGIAAALALLAACAPLGAYLAAPGPSWQTAFIEDFSLGHVAKPDAFTNVGFIPTSRGWSLAPGAEGRLVYRIDKDPGSHIAVAVWLNASGPTTMGNFDVRIGDSSTHYVNPIFKGDVIDLKEANSAGSVRLELSARNDGDSDALVLDQFIWGVIAGEAPPKPNPLSYAAAGALGALVAVPLLRTQRRRWLIAGAIGVLVALTVASRLEALALTAMRPLDPDAITFRIYGMRFEWWPPWTNGLFSANFSEREPFYPLVLNTVFSALGSSDFRLRTVSSTFSMLAIVLTLMAARRHLSWPIAIGVAMVVVLNKPLIIESIRGLRTELEMCGVLALYLVLDRPVATAPVREGIVAGVLGTILALTRTIYLPMIAVAAGIAFLARYRPPKAALVPILVSLTLVLAAVAGHRVAMYERRGDAFFDMAGYARWQANVEKFSYGYTLQHPELFPTRAEYLEKGPYYGPRISYAQYLFEIHTLPEFVVGTALGLVDIFGNSGGLYLGENAASLVVSRVADEALRWLSLAGLLGLAISAARQRSAAPLLLPSIVIGGLGLTAFLYHLKLVEPYRNTILFYPLALVAGGLFAEQAFRWVRGRRWATSAVGQVPSPRSP